VLAGKNWEDTWKWISERMNKETTITTGGDKK
jgi:hypothetical protein